MDCPDCGGELEHHTIVDAAGSKRRSWCRDCGREVGASGERVGGRWTLALVSGWCRIGVTAPDSPEIRTR